MFAFSLVCISLISSAVIAKKIVIPTALGYKNERSIGMDDLWPQYMPDIDEMDDITPYLLEFINDPRVDQTQYGECDRVGMTGKQFHRLRCFLNIIRRCRFSEDKCENSLRNRGDAGNKNSVAFQLLSLFKVSQKKRLSAQKFLNGLANSTFKVLPTTADVVFSLAVMYVRLGDTPETRQQIGRLHLALLRVSYIKDKQFKRLYDSVLSSNFVSKRAENAGFTSLTNYMLSLCNLTAVLTDKTILAGCLAGVGAFCQDKSKLSDCWKYYETVYGKSIYAPVGSTCPNWKSGTTSKYCSDAVNGICSKYGSNSGECGFSKFSQAYIFTNATLAPW